MKIGPWQKAIFPWSNFIVNGVNRPLRNMLSTAEVAQIDLKWLGTPCELALKDLDRFMPKNLLDHCLLAELLMWESEGSQSRRVDHVDSGEKSHK